MASLQSQLLQVLEEASSIGGLGGIESPDFAPSSDTAALASRGRTPPRPLAQKIYPSYTNFSLVPATATRQDVMPFLRGGGGEVKDNNNNAGKSKQRPKKKRGPNQVFPRKLHQVLSDPTLSDVITWMPHGRSWSILDPSAFVERVSQKYFAQSKLDSFKRQVRGWGFRLKKTSGADQGSYYHELFLRGKPHLARYMETTKTTSRQMIHAPPKSRGSIGDMMWSFVDEPDLFKISTVFPVRPCQGATMEESVGAQGDGHRKTPEKDAAAAATGTLPRIPSRTGCSTPEASCCSTLPTTDAAVVSPRAADRSSFAPTDLPTSILPPFSMMHPKNGTVAEEARPAAAHINRQSVHFDPVSILEEEEGEGEVDLLSSSDLRDTFEYVERHLIRPETPPMNCIVGTGGAGDDMWGALCQQNISLEMSDRLLLSLADDDENIDEAAMI